MRLFHLADSTGLSVPSSAWTIPAAMTQPPNGAAPLQVAPEPAAAAKGKASGADGHQDKAGLGHNSKGVQMPKDDSGNAPSWATPSKLSLDEAAKALIGPGRYAQERRALIEAIFDPRLGIAPLPLQLLAAVVECINGKTGMAYPGNRHLAQRIANYVNGLPVQYREGALRNAATLVRQAGYAVSEKRAAEKGGRAIAHFSITCPTPEEKQAGIDAYLREKHGLPQSVVTRGMTSACGHSGGDLSCGHPADDLRLGCGHPGTEAEVTRGVKKGPPLFITEPDSINPKTLSGAGAPGGGATDLFAEGDPGEPPPLEQSGAPDAGAQRKRAPAKPKATEEQFARFWTAYPIREGKAAARKNFLNLTRDEADLAIVGAAGYAAKMAAERAKRGEEPRIKWAQGWLSARRFEDYAPTNAAAPAGPSLAPGWWRDDPGFAATLEAADWQLLHDTHIKNGTWPADMMGPPPGAPGCLVPRDVVAKLKRGGS
jgi:hypothetical protein